MKISIGKGEVFALTAAFLWGINYLLEKKILQVVPESQFLIIRFVLTVGLLAIYLRMIGENFKIEKGHYIPTLVLGIFGVGFYNILWTYGIHLTTASNAALLIATSPIFTGIYAVFRKEEQISPSRWAGTLLAFLGIYLIVQWTPGSRFSFASSVFLGNVLVLAGSSLFALYAIVAKPLLSHYSPIKLTTLAMGGDLWFWFPIVC